jgi:hypothetical protein
MYAFVGITKCENSQQKFKGQFGIVYLTNCYLEQRSQTDGPRENFGGPWRNLDIICNFYFYYTVSLYYYIISNKQQQISH